MLDSQDSRFFGALYALTVNHGGSRAGLTPSLLAAFDVERVVDFIQRPIVAPPVETVVNRASWRKVLWNVPPVATGAENIHQAVHDRADVDSALVATWFGGWDQWLNLSLLFIRQIMGVAQAATVASETGLICPHWAPQALMVAGRHQH